MMELGRINITTKESSSHVGLSREKHLDTTIHVMTHVDQWYSFLLVYDHLYLEIDQSVFKKCDWSEFYMDFKEAILVNAPEPQGKKVEMQMFVDSDHAGVKVSCRTRSSFLIYVNTTLVHWFSKNILH